MGIERGRVAVVSGASRGIGAAAARGLAEAGAAVALLGRTASALEEVAASIVDTSGTAIAVPTDITDLAQVEAARDRITAALGPVTILVNNAAVGEPLARVWEADPDDFEANLRANVTGAFHTLRCFVPTMLAEGHGRIVAIGSDAGSRAIPTLGAYSASKAAFERLHHVAAAELAGTNIRCNIVWPGGVDTELQGILRDDRFAMAAVARRVHAEGQLRRPEDTTSTIVGLCDEDEERQGALIRDVG